MTKQYVAYGPGFSGDFDTLQEAAEVVASNRCGEVYVPYAEVEHWREQLERTGIDMRAWKQRAETAETEAERLRAALTTPIPMYLRCTRCALPHIDRGEWATRPHKTHLCEGCGHTWRVSDHPTVGVEVLPSQLDNSKAV